MCNNENIIDIVKNNYKRFYLENSDISAVVIGGSVSRGYANKGCDVDILYFDKNVKHYKKRFEYIANIKLELHYVPIDIFELLYSYIESVCDSNVVINKSKLDYSLWGEKNCQKLIKKDNEISNILSAWRELRKLLDGVIVYEREKWYTNLQMEYNLSPNLEKINCLIDYMESTNENYINKVINLMKLYMMSKNAVYSKVYWTDYYLTNTISLLKNQLEEIFDIKKSILQSWFASTIHRFEFLKCEHKKTDCDFCRGLIMKCNIGRCANDFINDAIRAFDNNLIIGSLLSLKRANDYMDRLSNINNIEIPKMPMDYICYWEKIENMCHNDYKKIKSTLFELDKV